VLAIVYTASDWALNGPCRHGNARHHGANQSGGIGALLVVPGRISATCGVGADPRCHGGRSILAMREGVLRSLTDVFTG
jgi:hypothetical protein